MVRNGSQKIWKPSEPSLFSYSICAYFARGFHVNAIGILQRLLEPSQVIRQLRHKLNNSPRRAPITSKLFVDHYALNESLLTAGLNIVASGGHLGAKSRNWGNVAGVSANMIQIF